MAQNDNDGETRTTGLPGVKTFDSDPPFVSVIVPVRNGQETIAACLESLTRQTYPNLEIIVVDNGSTDDTISLLDTFPVHILHEPEPGSYKARNRGLQAASGSLIYFTDSDCVVPAETIGRLVETLNQNSVAGAGGQVRAHQPDSMVERFGSLAGILSYDLPRGPVTRSRSTFLSGGLITANVLFRKDILDEAGRFDDNLLSGGDYELCWRILAAGYPLYFEPEAWVLHFHRATLGSFLRQFHNYGRWQPALLRRQPEKRSYLRVKTFIGLDLELAVHSPLRFLIDVDLVHWLILLSLLPLAVPVLFPWSFLPLLFLLAGLGWKALGAVRQTKNVIWLVLFPAFHLLRSAAFAMGRIRGGIRERVLSC